MLAKEVVGLHWANDFFANVETPPPPKKHSVRNISGSTFGSTFAWKSISGDMRYKGKRFGTTRDAKLNHATGQHSTCPKGSFIAQYAPFRGLSPKKSKGRFGRDQDPLHLTKSFNACLFCLLVVLVFDI